jgi:guanylate kinase
MLPDSRAIFILPPSRETLEQRLNSRGQDDAATIAARMAEAVEEISHFSDSDYLVVNEEFDRALKELEAIITSQRLRTCRQREALPALLQDLIS